MASRFYALMFVALTGIVGMVSPPDMAVMVAQAQTTKNREVEADRLLDLGIQQFQISQFEAALQSWQQALNISREIKYRLGEGQSLGNLGIAYEALGKYDKAIEFHLQSLEVAREIKSRLGEGVSLGNLGSAYDALGKYDKAIEFYLQALAILREIKDRRGEGTALGNLGVAYYYLGKYDKAIEFHLQRLVIAREIKDRIGEGQSLGNLGIAYGSLDKYDKAIEFLLQRLVIARETKDRQGEGSSLNNLGFAFKNLNQPELAILFYKQSVNVTEAIRKDIRKLDKDIQKSYLATVEDTYRDLADLLLKQDRIIEALQVFDLLKVQELDDYLKNIKGNDRTSKGIRLLEPEKALSSQLLAINSENSVGINKQLSTQIQQLPKSEIDKAPDYLQNLPQGTALLYPLILDDRLEIVIFAPNTPAIHRTVNIKKTELENLISAFRKNLTEPYLDARDSSQKLYDVLIKPIEEDLKQTKANTILYAPDGQLRYIPLAALYDGKQWLIEKYRINNLIAYILFDQNSKTQTNPSIFAGAYGNSNQKLVSGFNQLPATIPEVESIKTTFANTTAITEQNFTADASKSKAVGNAIVHLATHASFQSGSPLDSYVLFGDGSKATISDISEWNLKDVNLFVLSACQTGLGTSANGTEILGFGYQVQRAGAKASISTLWKVSDGGTQKLMDAFYTAVKTGKISNVEALRQAQVAMITGNSEGLGEPRSIVSIEARPRATSSTVPAKISHPYYWAAFILIGNGL